MSQVPTASPVAMIGTSADTLAASTGTAVTHVYVTPAKVLPTFACLCLSPWVRV